MYMLLEFQGQGACNDIMVSLEIYSSLRPKLSGRKPAALAHLYNPSLTVLKGESVPVPE